MNFSNYSLLAECTTPRSRSNAKYIHDDVQSLSFCALFEGEFRAMIVQWEKIESQVG